MVAPVTIESPTRQAYEPAPEQPTTFSSQTDAPVVLSLHLVPTGPAPTADDVRALTKLDLEPEPGGKLARLRELRAELARFDSENEKTRSELHDRLREIENDRAAIEAGAVEYMADALNANAAKAEAVRQKLDAVGTLRDKLVAIVGKARAEAKAEAQELARDALAERRDRLEHARRDALARLAALDPGILDELLLFTRALSLVDQATMAGGVNPRGIADQLLGPP